MLGELVVTKQQETEQADWAERYKQLLNEPDVRNRLSGPGLGWSPFGVRVGRSLRDRGTIYQVYDADSAHYMAYRVVPSSGFAPPSVEVYDPASSSSTFRDDELLPKLAKMFHPMPVKIIEMYHQIDLYKRSAKKPWWQDTWCQTWTLAWLDNSWRSLLVDVPTSHEQALDTMIQIIPRVLQLGARTERFARDFQLLLDQWYDRGYFDRRRFSRFYNDEKVAFGVKVVGR